jgi:poly(A) polymerase
MSPESAWIIQKLTETAGALPLYLAGGVVRDWLLGRQPVDIDVVVPSGSLEAASAFARATGGTLVPLDEREGVARVVAMGRAIDFSRFRKGAGTIEQDLLKRDFSINAMAVAFEDAHDIISMDHPDSNAINTLKTRLVDPLGGLRDLAEKRLRVTGKDAFAEDPLRIMRAFRFAATYGLEISPDTVTMIKKEADRLNLPAMERINHELDLIMRSARAGRMFMAMKTLGVLKIIIPETEELTGVEQPGFHHLDVSAHCLAALSVMDELVDDPASGFARPEHYRTWLNGNGNRIAALKWAAFTHDFGKPRKKKMKDGRITFYNHDAEGADMVKKLAARLRWPHRERDFTVSLVRLHMRPFHLLTPFGKGQLTKRALTRLLHATGPDYPALFLLAMADSKAGCGPLKPPDLDNTLDALGMKVHEYFLKKFSPAVSSPRLLTGNDIMKTFRLAPGPLIGKLLDLVEDATIEGKITSRKAAEEYIEKCLGKLT